MAEAAWAKQDKLRTPTTEGSLVPADTSAMTAATTMRCPACGRDSGGEQCARCHGTVVQLGGEPVRPGRGLFPLDLLAGFAGMWRGVLWLAHQPEFFGLLRLPVAANALVFGPLLLGFALVLQPLFASWWQLDWGPLDVLRRAQPETGPLRLLLATGWLLGPSLLDASAGALAEPLGEATERAMTGQPERPTAAGWRLFTQRLRDRARVLVVLLLALPFAWCLVLVPRLGLAMTFIGGAAAAAVVWFEPPSHRAGYDTRSRLLLLRRNWARALGFGAAFQVAMAVPLLNLLGLVPATAVGATATWFHFDKDQRSS